MALKMNWKVWTPFQFINVNFVPVQVQYVFHWHPVVEQMMSHTAAVMFFSPLCCIFICLFLLLVPSAVCQCDRPVLVCLPFICEEMRCPKISSQKTNLEEDS